MDRETLTTVHDKKNSLLFFIKTKLLALKRMVQNVRSRIQQHPIQSTLSQTPIIARSESELWNPDDNPQNWILTAGKIQNLRIAIQHINGLEIPANATFSFWKHIGNPNWGKKYVIGREIREGCVVPTIAGGLCQLSNALYDAALIAGFEIVERHRHTKVVKGSLAEKNRDATVKWNYLDLRFRSNHAFRIEARLTDSQLIIVFKSTSVGNSPDQSAVISQPVSLLNDCYSCGNTSCFKHPTGKIAEHKSGTTVYLLDEQWPEFERYLTQTISQNTLVLATSHHNRWLKSKRYQWSFPKGTIHKSVNFTALRRAIQLRLAVYKKRNPFEASLKTDQLIASRLIKQLPIDCTHLVIAQNLLPFCWKSGVLGGRTFDVLMTRLPINTLHERLDQALTQHPESSTLADFRAPNWLLEAENSALTQAQYIITPHTEIAAIFQNKSRLLDWQLPEVAKQTSGHLLLFPASSLGRKGAYLVKQLARELDLSIAVSGTATDHAGFWEECSVRQHVGLKNVGLVIYPTYIEHQPRLLLRAIAMGIPVITTTAAGIPAQKGVTVLSIGDYEGLKEAVVFECGKAGIKL